MAILNQIMSPLLPVALEVGQLHVVERLKVNFGKFSGEMLCECTAEYVFICPPSIARILQGY